MLTDGLFGECQSPNKMIFSLNSLTGNGSSATVAMILNERHTMIKLKTPELARLPARLNYDYFSK